MPCELTAFSVKIASPGDAAHELFLAREVIYDWNGCHGLGQKRILLPVPGDVNGEGDACDLLIALVARNGSREAEGEVERQLKTGRPALVYCSEVRAHLGETPGMVSLDASKKRFGAQAIIDSFSDEKELRSKLTEQLETLMGDHPHFQRGNTLLPVTATESHPPVAPEVSKAAQSLLISACDDSEAYIGRNKDDGGLKIQVNGRQLVEPGDPESAATWDGALEELIGRGLVRDAGCHGRLFQISTKGFEFLETLGKYPIGYIAELGGM